MTVSRFLSIFSIYFAFIVDRFGYYGMRALIIIYMISDESDGLGLEREEALSYYGYLAIVIGLMAVPAGLFSDFISGRRWGVIIGMALSSIGTALIPFGGINSAMIGVLLICLGTNFVRNNLWVLLGNHYFKTDNIRDSMFTFGYFFLNVGSFLGITSVGFVGEKYGWKWGFLMAALVIFVGMLVFFLGTYKMKLVEEYGVSEENGDKMQEESLDAHLISKNIEAREISISKSFLFIFLFAIVSSLFYWPVYGILGTEVDVFANANQASWPMSGEPVGYQIGMLSSGLSIVFLLSIGVLFFFKNKFSSWWKIGVGIMVMILAIPVILSIIETETSSSNAFWITFLVFSLLGLSEAFFQPVLFSMVTRVSPLRYGSTFLGIYAVLGSLIDAVMRWVDREFYFENTPKLYFLGGILFLIGVAFFTMRKPLQKFTNDIIS